MRSLIVSLASTLVLAVGACGGSSSSAPAATGRTAPAEPPSGMAEGTCPVEVPGTSVTVEDTATGAAMVFVTTGDVEELRRRVSAVAAMHNEHHGAMGELPTGEGGGGQGHMHGGHGAGHAGHGQGHGAGHAGHGQGHAGEGPPPGMMIMAHTRAVATDVDGGARVELVANPDDVQALQSELRQHAAHLSSGTCAMAHGSAHGEAHGPGGQGHGHGHGGH